MYWYIGGNCESGLEIGLSVCLRCCSVYTLLTRARARCRLLMSQDTPPIAQRDYVRLDLDNTTRSSRRRDGSRTELTLQR